MKMKAKTNRRALKIVIAICLVVALLAAMGVATFAWIRNYVAVENINLTTGKMLYKITLYQKDKNGNWAATTFFDTGEEGKEDDAARVESVETQIVNGTDTINITPGEQVFFVIEKYPDSVDLDATISFEKDGGENYYTYMGQTNFQIEEASGKLAEKLDDTSTVADAVSALAGTTNGGKPNSMSMAWETVQKTKSLEGNSSDYACVRMAFSQDTENQSNDVTDKSFPLKVKFCVTQKGAPLPGETAGKRWDVSTETQFKEFLANYDFGDELYLTNNVVCDGDMVLTRPCKITLLRSTLTIKGNLIFSYGYEGDFSLNTVSDGHIKVEKNFQIALPNGKINLEGANNAADGMADVYVGGKFTVNASKAENKGAYFKGLRVCNADESLKPLIIDGTLGLYTTNRTNLGKISAANYGDDYGFTVSIDNRGTIEQIDLTNMIQDKTFKKSPCILIDNAGTLTDDTIRLPSWSQKFSCDTKGTEVKTDDTFEGNTRIFANKGSGTMKAIAITANRIDAEGNIVWPNDSSELTKYFISNRDAAYGDRDDIEYAVRYVFVDVIEKDNEGDPINVVIHYEQPSDVAMSSDSTLEILGTLSTYPALYEYDYAKFETVKIICYGEKALSEADYAFIREMTALEELDLSEAVSETKTVPAGAFSGMTNLSSVIMSESDTAWDKNIFKDTKVDEITFPQALTRLLNTRNSSGKVSAQDVLTGIKYVYTSITKVEGIWANSKSTQYFFTPDEYSYATYRDLITDNLWRSKVFMNNGVVRFGTNGEIFLRYDPDAPQDARFCEFVVQTDASKAWTDDAKSLYGFDFNNINIDEAVYKIVSYDPYALYGKLTNEPNLLNIEFGANLEVVGKYAFAANSKIASVKFADTADTKLMGYTFYQNAALVSVYAPAVTTLDGGYNFAKNSALRTFNMPNLSTVNDDADLGECPILERVDISVIEYKTDNQNFYSAETTDDYNNDYKYAKFFIHTENAPERRDITFNKALGAKYRYIFVNTEYANLYTSVSGYTGVADIGNNQVSEIKTATDLDATYYYYIDGENACLIACLTDIIDKSTEDSYTLVSSFEGDTYPITKVGSAAYHFTIIRAKVLNIPSTVEEIGRYAFYATFAKFYKQCGTIDLKNVTKVGDCAFESVDMVSIIGEELLEVGKDALTNNDELVLAILPKLSKSLTNGQLNEVFVGAKNLRVAYISISDNISYDNKLSRQKGYVRFVNVDEENVSSSTINLSNINTIINGTGYTPAAGFYRNFVNLSDYKGVYISDFYNYEKNFKATNSSGMVMLDMEITVALPSYVFFEQKDLNGNSTGKLTLFAVSPDVALETEYTTPNYLYIDTAEQSNNTVYNVGPKEKKPVSVIGGYAYGLVSMNGKVNRLTIAPNIDTVEEGAFRGIAYLSSTMTNTVIGDSVSTVDLASVTSVGSNAFNGSKFVNLKADIVKNIGSYAFANCSNLEKVYFPMFEMAEGSHAFSGCTALTEITFGKDTETLVHNMFEGAKALTKITILNETTPVSLTGDSDVTLVPSYSSQVHVYVHGGIYDEYLTAFDLNPKEEKGTFGGIPAKNVHKYGEAVIAGDIIYYLEPISSSTASLDFIDANSALPSSFIIPPTLTTKAGNGDTYTIVAVSPSAMSSLNGVKTLTLPSGMAYLTFTGAALADSIETLVIDDKNKSFMTVDGVLYSEDGTVLYVYPKAKAAESFAVNSTVAQIYDEAFYGVSKLKTITVEGVVAIGDRAFAYATLLESITFESATPSTFAGREILNGANVNLKIYVPSGTLADYKAKVLVDYSILDRIEELQ